MIQKISSIFLFLLLIEFYTPVSAQPQCDYQLINKIEYTELVECQYPQWTQDASRILCRNNYSRLKKYSKIDDISVYVDVSTLKVKAKKGDSTWLVTPKGERYYSPIISKDRSKVVVHTGSKMQVFNINGDGFMFELGWGIACSWSPDNNKILFIRDESPDGHVISGSEIYMVNQDGSGLCKLTDTPDITELWVDWSPKGNKIAYFDDVTEKVYICEISER